MPVTECACVWMCACLDGAVDAASTGLGTWMWLAADPDAACSHHVPDARRPPLRCSAPGVLHDVVCRAITRTACVHACAVHVNARARVCVADRGVVLVARRLTCHSARSHTLRWGRALQPVVLRPVDVPPQRPVAARALWAAVRRVAREQVKEEVGRKCTYSCIIIGTCTGTQHTLARSVLAARGQRRRRERVDVHVVVVRLHAELQAAVLARLRQVAFPAVQHDVLHGVARRAAACSRSPARATRDAGVGNTHAYGRARDGASDTCAPESQHSSAVRSMQRDEDTQATEAAVRERMSSRRHTTTGGATRDRRRTSVAHCQASLHIDHRHLGDQLLRVAAVERRHLALRTATSDATATLRRRCRRQRSGSARARVHMHPACEIETRTENRRMPAVRCRRATVAMSRWAIFTGFTPQRLRG
jgi:hypothetical protein